MLLWAVKCSGESRKATFCQFSLLREPMLPC